MRGPVDRLTENMPRPWRIAIDWIVTIVGAVAIVLLIKACVVNPYRIPSSSMEPTLHCAKPGLDCEAGYSDRVLANRFIYHFTDPTRKDIVVFNTPQARAGAVRRGRHVREAASIGLSGRHGRPCCGDGHVRINGKKLDEPATSRTDRLGGESGTVEGARREHLHDGRQPPPVVRLARLGAAAAKSELIGKVFAIYWPPKRIGFLRAGERRRPRGARCATRLAHPAERRHVPGPLLFSMPNIDRQPRAAPAAHGPAAVQGRRHRARPLPGDRGPAPPRPGLRGHRDQAPGRRRARDVHRPQAVVRRRRRAHVPAALAEDREDRGAVRSAT